MGINIIAKALLVFWSMVFAVIALKYTTDMLNSNSNFIVSTGKSKIINRKGEIHIVLETYSGLVLDGVRGCMKNHKFDTSNLNISRSNSCVNGKCKLTVEFEDSIPNNIGLYVKENSKCIEKTFNVESNMQVLGYRVDLKLSPDQKDSLGIENVDDIELKNASGYSFSPIHKYFYYNLKMKKDTISENGVNKGIIYFNNNYDASTDESQNTNVSKGTLFTYDCNTANTTCTRTANTYILLIDGIFVELDTDFIEECKYSRKKLNKYCKQIIFPGQSILFTTSPNIIKHLLKNGANPKPSKYLDKRIEAAKEKIYN